MDIVTMELFIKNDDRYVANTAKIDKVLQWKRNPYFYGISEDYIRGKITDLYQGDDKNDKWDEEIAENNMRTIQLSIDDLGSVRDQVAEVHPVESLQKE